LQTGPANLPAASLQAAALKSLFVLQKQEIIAPSVDQPNAKPSTPAGRGRLVYPDIQRSVVSNCASSGRDHQRQDGNELSLPLGPRPRPMSAAKDERRRPYGDHGQNRPAKLDFSRQAFATP